MGMEIKKLNGVEFRVMPREFGDGWMSSSACDYFRILVIAGFDPLELCKAIFKVQRSNGTTMVNTRTVDKAVKHLYAIHPEWAEEDK